METTPSRSPDLGVTLLGSGLVTCVIRPCQGTATVFFSSGQPSHHDGHQLALAFPTASTRPSCRAAPMLMGEAKGLPPWVCSVPEATFASSSGV